MRHASSLTRPRVLGMAGAVLASLVLASCGSPRTTDVRPAAAQDVRWPALEPVDAAKKHALRVEYGVWIPMRDGVRLSADVYRPEGEGRYPVILSRTPYNKAGAGKASIDRYRMFVERGYVVVVQDVRGRGDSEGQFTPFLQEGDDGYDTIEWCGTQPWSSGKVGMIGGSYGGYVQWVAAIRQPRHLAAIVPTVACPDPFVDGLINGPTGLPSPICVSWYFYTSGRLNQQSHAVEWARVFEHLPIIDLDDRAGRAMPIWDEFVRNSRLGPYWEPARYQHRLGQVTIPTLNISGWYDDEQISTITNFAGVIADGNPGRDGAHHALLMGPWPHSVNSGTKVGEIEFGPTAKIDMDAYVLRWFDRWLKGIENGVEHEPPVRHFVMGENAWKDAATWPIPGTTFTPYYLRSEGNANSRLGDGFLSTEMPASGETPDSYVYDPGDATPFLTDPMFSQIGGPDDYSGIELRSDMLVFSTPVMTAPVEICGPIKATLWASSDAPDTDFMVRVLNVHPSGFSQRLSDGVVRARFREGMDAPSLITPGQIYEYEIDVWTTCQTILPGHAIRVEVMSASFPQWDRNPNTGSDLGMGTEFRSARQTIYHDAARPSHVVLPVVRR
ncbi:MAG: CocE/NonD family hydrolase [Phycisphaeraceae bacterium]|nr:CocE/NonD family hydrolase [Phycisphaeraceae bacterium]